MTPPRPSCVTSVPTEARPSHTIEEGRISTQVFCNAFISAARPPPTATARTYLSWPHARRDDGRSHSIARSQGAVRPGPTPCVPLAGYVLVCGEAPVCVRSGEMLPILAGNSIQRHRQRARGSWAASTWPGPRPTKVDA